MLFNRVGSEADFPPPFPLTLTARPPNAAYNPLIFWSKMEP